MRTTPARLWFAVGVGYISKAVRRLGPRDVRHTERVTREPYRLVLIPVPIPILASTLDEYKAKTGLESSRRAVVGSGIGIAGVLGNWANAMANNFSLGHFGPKANMYSHIIRHEH